MTVDAEREQQRLLVESIQARRGGRPDWEAFYRENVIRSSRLAKFIEKHPVVEQKPFVPPVLSEEQRLERDENRRLYNMTVQKQWRDKDVRGRSIALAGADTRYAGIRLRSESTKPTSTVCFLAKEMRQPARSYLLLGDTGCGKTYAAISFIAEISSGKPIRAKAYRMAEAIYRREFEVLDNLRTVPYLLIDDLGAEPEGFRGSDFLAFFDNLMDDRWERQLTTVITSNLTVETSRDAQGNAIRRGVRDIYGQRFVSRFNEDGKVFEAKDKDMRVKR
jgi:DNA replication protein DnaC